MTAATCSPRSAKTSSRAARSWAGTWTTSGSNGPKPAWLSGNPVADLAVPQAGQGVDVHVAEVVPDRRALGPHDLDERLRSRRRPGERVQKRPRPAHADHRFAGLLVPGAPRFSKTAIRTRARTGAT